MSRVASIDQLVDHHYFDFMVAFCWLMLVEGFSASSVTSTSSVCWMAHLTFDFYVTFYTRLFSSRYRPPCNGAKIQIALLLLLLLHLKSHGHGPSLAHFAVVLVFVLLIFFACVCTALLLKDVCACNIFVRI